MAWPLNGKQLILHVCMMCVGYIILPPPTFTSVGAVCEILVTQDCALLTTVTGVCTEIFARQDLYFLIHCMNGKIKLS